MILGGRVINPGDLRTRITLKARAVSTETGGFQRPTWPTTIAVVWAKWNNVHGSEVWAADANQVTQPATALIRYRADVDETCAVDREGKIYEVVSVDDIENRHEFMELALKAVRGA